MRKDQVALYLDFENLVISAEQVYPREQMPLQVEPIVDFASNKGTVAIKKAYANWNYPLFRQYQRVLVEQGFELVHLPETTIQGKSWADVRIAIAVLEDLALYPQVQSVLLGSQDTDFIPLLQSVKSKGREVVVLGFSQFVGNLLKKNSTEFISLHELFGGEAEQAVEEEEYDIDGLFRRLQASHGSDEPIFMTNLKQNLLKLDPSFSERQLGFHSFSQFARSLVGKYIERIDKDAERGAEKVILKQQDKKAQQRKSKGETAHDFLVKGMKFVKNPKQRKDMIHCIATTPGLSEGLTLPQITEDAKKALNVSGVVMSKFVFQLYNAGVLEQRRGDEGGPLYDRKIVLSPQYTNVEGIENAYLERMRFLLLGKFPSLSDAQVQELLRK